MNLINFLFMLLFGNKGWTTEMVVTGISEIDAAIPEFWAPGVIVDANRESFWGALSGGEGSGMPIIEKTGPLKEKGDQITFTTIVQIMGAGVSGESVLKGKEQKVAIGTFTVTADVIRNAMGVGRKATKEANFDMVKQVGIALKDWYTRKFDADKFSAMLDSTTVETLYANGKTSAGSLNSTDGDILGPSDITKLRLGLQRQGAMPLKVTKANGRSVPIYGMAIGEIEEYNLTQNSTFNQTIKDIWARFSKGSDHPLIQGAIGMYSNMIIYPYYSVLPIPQGTPLRPETLLSATCVTAGTLVTVGTTVGDTYDDYTAFFASTGSLQIDDEILGYTSKTINSFVVAAYRGLSSTTAAQHVPGALVTQRNISTVIGFGAEALFTAMPEASEPIGQDDDYKEQKGLGIRACYGNKVKVDARRGKANNLVLMKCYSENPGTI
jgi:N4-gp56 family major capsid protein